MEVHLHEGFANYPKAEIHRGVGGKTKGNTDDGGNNDADYDSAANFISD